MLGYEQPFKADGGFALGDSSKRTQDHFATRRKEWPQDVEAIITKLNCHESFTVKDGLELTNLPRFSDTMNYQVSEAEQHDLWTLEVHRLISVINAKEPPKHEGSDEWFGGADRDGYRRLDKLATQLELAISICILDNELLLLEFDPEVSNPDAFQSARRQLVDHFGPESLNSTLGSIRLAENNDGCYQALVNYVTVTLLQVLLRAVEGDVWDENVITTMAKVATKLKIVCFDLEKSAAVCLAGASDWDKRLRRQQQNDFPLPSSEDMSRAQDKQLAAAQRRVTHRGHQYFKMMDAFQQCINILLSHIAEDLASDRTITAASDSFEACSIIYDTGLLQQRSMLCQNRSGAIGGSGHPADVHCAGFAFDVCLDVLEKLHSTQPVQSPNESMAIPEIPHTSLYWKWTQILPSGNKENKLGSKKDASAREAGTQLGAPRTGTVHLTSMKDVITALVPFFMLCGSFPSQLRAMIYNVHSIANRGEPMRTCEEVRFLASFMARTSSYRFASGSDFTPVSASTIARKRALAQWPRPSSSTMSSPSDSAYDEDGADSPLQDDLRRANAQIADGLRLIDSWVIDENSIVIPYRWYCWGSLGLCGGLVLGGLALGFTVQQRIKGVDPFNISVFCWALAGFLILFFKSIRVQEWPWRDFFLGRVVCRSVSEVVAVSWIDPQLLLSILLRLEPVMILNKRGPFESVFHRRDPDGFAIDIPLSTAAVNEGGCFFVKVQSDTGPAIMCVRLNYQNRYNSVGPHDYSDTGDEFKCRYLDTPWRWGKGADEGPLYSLMTNRLDWTRVIGLHCEKAYFD